MFYLINELIYLKGFGTECAPYDLNNSRYTNSYTNGIKETDMYANLRQPN